MYHHTRFTKQAVASLMAQRDGSARALLVSGEPGTGKTSLAEAIATEHGGVMVYALLHAWSGADDLFAGVSVQAAVAGDADNVSQPGVLALAAEASHQHSLVVVCLDELDKAQEPVEGLLLDWLQSGRVPVKPGVHLETRLERVLVVITTNQTRPHTDALLRRCRRLRMAALPEKTRLEIAIARSGAPAGVVRLIDRACQAVAYAEGTYISVQEIANAAAEAWHICMSTDDVAECLRAWAARTDDGVRAVNTQSVRHLVDSIWGEIAAQRRRK